MAYPQAFHTSCRNGLSGHAGFQFNAASVGLDERQLSGLAAAHAGYRPAPDFPMEPDAAEIAQLPVSLRYLPVEGVGPVVSRTAYVGREFRGRDGEPDSGRFGNYFSHILAAPGEEPSPFDGLMPIELWEAPHWSTTESTTTELPLLDRVDPGPVDLEWVLAELLPQREETLGPVLDACLRALLGGPRVVVVEPEPALAAAWIAWASFALPADRVKQLTFSTFEGRPRTAEAMRMCLTTPACDLDFPAYEIGSAVTIVDVRAPAAEELSLYARVAAALAEEGAEAVAAAVRDLEPDLDLEGAGAQLAVLARRADLVRPGEIAPVLATLRRMPRRLSPQTMLAVAAALPEEVDSPATLSEWSRLHAAARQGDDPDEADLVDLTLDRVLGGFRQAAEVEPVERDPRVSPSVAALVRWSGMVSAAGSDRLGEVLEAGARLRLVGLNSALDRELVGAVADGLRDPGVRRAFDAIAAEGNETVVAGVALELAARFGAGGSLGPLRYVARQRVAYEAVRAKAAEDSSFATVAAWEALRVEKDPSHRPAAVARLAELATTDRQAELIRALYGKGPGDPAEHAELLGGWATAGRGAPREDYERALTALTALPLRPDRVARSLFDGFRRAPKPIRESPESLSWWLLFEAPPEGRSFPEWVNVLLDRRGPFAKLAEVRRRELGALAAEVAAASLEEKGYADTLDRLAEGLGRDWRRDLGDAMGQEIRRHSEPVKTVALAFVEWSCCPKHGGDLLEEALPRATRDLSPRQLEEVEKRFDEAWCKAWKAWLEEHPPSRAVSRAVRGVFRRGEEGR